MICEATMTLGSLELNKVYQRMGMKLMKESENRHLLHGNLSIILEWTCLMKEMNLKTRTLLKECGYQLRPFKKQSIHEKDPRERTSLVSFCQKIMISQSLNKFLPSTLPFMNLKWEPTTSDQSQAKIKAEKKGKCRWTNSKPIHKIKRSRS